MFIEEFLIQLGTLSIQASIVVAVVFVLRWLFAKLHVAKKYTMFLWLVPYVCMVCPWKMKLPFSFWGKGETLFSKFSRLAQSIEHKIFVNPVSRPFAGLMNGTGSDAAKIGSTAVSDKIDAFGTAASTGNNQSMSQLLGNLTAADLMYIILFAFWLVVFLLLAGYALYSYWRLKKRLLCSVQVSEKIYYADGIDTAFVVGFFKPVIYLPANIEKEYADYVIAHEMTHIKRFDPLKKLLALGVTCVHWFNPIIWLAFVMMSKDMEMTCDEETIVDFEMEQKKAYATALLQLSAPKNALFSAPLAFGEGSTKGRITNILKNKKAVRAVTEAAVLVIVLVALGFLGKTHDTTTLGSGELDEWITLPKDKNASVSVLYGEGNEVRFVVFPEAYGEIFIDYLNDLEVESNPITESRAEDRPTDVVIRIGESGELCFDEEMTEVWYNNHVKASYSYSIENPGELREFLETQLDSITEAIEAESDEDAKT